MERLMFTFALRPGQEDEYERRHQAVWPALLHDLYEAGWRNYSLFRRDLQIYAYAECHPDVATALQRMSASQANRRSWAGVRLPPVCSSAPRARFSRSSSLMVTTRVGRSPLTSPMSS